MTSALRGAAFVQSPHLTSQHKSRESDQHCPETDRICDARTDDDCGSDGEHCENTPERNQQTAVRRKLPHTQESAQTDEEVAGLRRKLAVAGSEVAAHSQAVAVLTARKQSQQAAIVTDTEVLRSVEAEVKSLSARLIDLRRERAAAEANLGYAQYRIGKLEGDVAGKEAELRELRSALSDLEARLAHESTNKSALSSQLSTRKSHISQLKAHLRTAKGRLFNHQMTTRQRQSDITGSLHRLHSEEARLSELLSDHRRVLDETLIHYELVTTAVHETKADLRQCAKRGQPESLATSLAVTLSWAVLFALGTWSYWTASSLYPSVGVL